MAITEKIAATTDAVSGATTEFATTSRGFWLFTSGFSAYERCIVERANTAGDGYEPATNENEMIGCGAYPNTVFVDLPAGTYRINKPATANAASVGYEEAS